MRIVVVVACIALAGCVDPPSVSYRIEDFNAKIRPDRAALTAAQIDLSADALRFGPYRTAPSEPTHDLLPDDPLAANLPQSDCWFTNLASDRVLSNWEAIGAVKSKSDSLRIGLCRFNDPVTRQFPSIEGLPAPYACDASGTSTIDAMFCRGDMTRLYDVALIAHRAPFDALGRCAVLRSAPAVSEPISQGVDDFDQPSRGQIEGRNWPGAADALPACVASAGLRPTQPTRYQLRAVDSPAERALAPMIVPSQAAASIARAMQVRGSRLEWSTPESRWGTASRWEDNFSSRLYVASVRILQASGIPTDRPVASVPWRTPGGEAPALCIVDPNIAGQACRWRCQRSAPWTYRLDDSHCRNSAGQPEWPLLTPTYAHDSAQRTLTAPLRFSVEANIPDAYLEFAMASRAGSAGLRSETTPPTSAIRVGTSIRIGLDIRNIGEQPLNIVSVGWVAGSSDFRFDLPQSPALVPLGWPVRDDGDWRTVDVPPALHPDWGRWSSGDGSVWARPAQRGSFVLGGQHFTWDGGLLFRENAQLPADWAAQWPTDAYRFANQSHVRGRTPFTLQPGEAFPISVHATPQAIGLRDARLAILGTSIVSGQAVRIEIPVSVRGLAGGLPQFLPPQLVLSAQNSAIGDRNALLVNDGDRPVGLSAPRITGIGGAPLPAAERGRFTLDLAQLPSGSIAPGASRALSVRYVGACHGAGYAEHRAELRWPTSAGDIVLPLQGSTSCP